MLDYQHIAYGSVPCVANPATNMLFAPFGAPTVRRSDGGISTP